MHGLISHVLKVKSYYVSIFPFASRLSYIKKECFSSIDAIWDKEVTRVYT